jgi:integrase
MANRSVTVWKSVKVNGRWNFYRPVIGKNGKIRPDWIHVNEHEEHHAEGHYYIHYREGKKQIWKKIGPDPASAERQSDYVAGHLHALAVGVPVKPEAIPLMVSHTLAGYLEEYRLSQSKESYALMKQTLEEFVNFTGKNYLDRITRLDLLRYKAWLVEKGRSVRTAGNKMLRANQYLRTVMKLKPGEGLVTVKDAKYVELEPEVYSQGELDAFFAACNPFQLAVFKTLLMSGLRKQELENLFWDDISFTEGTLKVCTKNGFRPKDWEERTVEVPSDLLEILMTLPRRNAYVFTTKTGGRYTHAWDDCQTIAKAAGVKDAHPHKFRATYATRLLQAGVDLKTVQKLLGHKNLESTMRYLARAESNTVRAKMDAVWNGKH